MANAPDMLSFLLEYGGSVLMECVAMHLRCTSYSTLRFVNRKVSAWVRDTFGAMFCDFSESVRVLSLDADLRRTSKLQTYASIKDAIAGGVSMMLLKPGEVYDEMLDISDAVSIFGNGATITRRVEVLGTFTATDCRFEGTVGITCPARVTMKRCGFFGDDDESFGVHVKNSIFGDFESKVRFDSCHFEHCGTAFWVHCNKGNFHVNTCVFENNATAIMLWGDKESRMTIANNTRVIGSTETGLDILEGTVHMQDCLLDYNKQGVYISMKGVMHADNVTIRDGSFSSVTLNGGKFYATESVSFGECWGRSPLINQGGTFERK